METDKLIIGWELRVEFKMEENLCLKLIMSSLFSERRIKHESIVNCRRDDERDSRKRSKERNLTFIPSCPKYRIYSV